MNRELLQQALDALRISAPLGHAMEDYEYRHKVIKDIEAELAKPEQDKPLRLSPMYEYGHIHDAAQPEPQVCCGNYEKCWKACTPRGRWLAEKELTRPEQEPVAWVYINEDGECEQIEYGSEGCDDPCVTPLYTAPPRKPWVGLTGIEVRMLKDIHIPIYSIPILDDYLKFYRAIENQLKEKNA